MQRNLRWFWWDGLFAQACDSIYLNYQTLFVLALGATAPQIGWLSAGAGFVSALMLLPGAALVERVGRPKELTVAFGGLLARFMLFFMALAPFVVGAPAIVPVVMVLVVLNGAAANLAFAPWASLTAEVVPLTGRGRYFSSRNIAMSIAAVIVTLTAGAVITRIGEPLGYQVALGVAFVFGLLSAGSFSRLQAPKPQTLPPPLPYTPRSLWRDLAARPNFLALCITAALWNFMLNIAGPFFNVYLKEGLQATAAQVGLLTVVTSLTALPALRLFGRLNDHWGSWRVQVLVGLLIPWVPALWVFVNAWWHVIPINIASGFLWAGYSLASFNLLLGLTPPDLRARYSALYQVVVTLSLAGGAALGGWLVGLWGYKTIFVISGMGRLVATLLFAWLVREKAVAVSK